jgi:CRISPR/Cas system-associated exonuclease Cas4 (RecB family)
MDVKINEKKRVSFSQFSWWLKCPHKWYLDYVKGLKQFEDSLNTCFGTAIHETIQTYVKTLYTESVEKADSINLYTLFKETFERELKNTEVKHTEDEYTDFMFDGEDILKEFTETATRIKHFPKEKYEFIDVELEIEVPVKNNINFVAYIDLVLREKKSGDIKIFDFKTSSNGWNDYMKDDYTKTAQLLLYKALYSKKFNVPLNKIDVEFFILKRKLYEGVNYPQSRIQLFRPPNSNSIVAGTVTDFAQFISESFTPEGTYIEDVKNFPKNPGDRKKNCKYCPHKKINCDQKQELA